MLDDQDIKIIKELLEPLATKKDLENEIEGLAVMMKNSFDITPTKTEVAEGFKTVNNRLSKIEKVEERVTQIEDAIALK